MHVWMLIHHGTMGRADETAHLAHYQKGEKARVKEEKTMQKSGLRIITFVALLTALSLPGLLGAQPASAQAIVFNQNEQLSIATLSQEAGVLPIVPPTAPCLPEPVLLSGNIHIVHHITITPDGVMHVVVHGNLQDVQGQAIGPIPMTYQATGAVTETQTINVGYPPSQGLLGQFYLPVSGQLIGQGSASSASVSFTLLEQVYRIGDSFIVHGSLASLPQVSCL
jgi:hypothetical protein